MHNHRLHQLTLATLLGALALTVSAQTTSSQGATQNPTTTTTSTGMPAATTDQSANAPAEPTKQMARHHAHKHMKHHHTAMRDTGDSSASGASDAAYRGALKQCVAGPSGQRDQCLDDTIAKYGHS